MLHAKRGVQALVYPGAAGRVCFLSAVLHVMFVDALRHTAAAALLHCVVAVSCVGICQCAYVCYDIRFPELAMLYVKQGPLHGAGAGVPWCGLVCCAFYVAC
jgi:hypothetical protein